MFRKSLAMILSVMVLTMGLFFGSALAQAQSDAKAIRKMQIEVAKIGVGRDAMVEAKLRDGSRVRGYVSAAEDDSFTVTDVKTGNSQRLAYADVVSVKKPRRELTPVTWGIIGGAAVAAIIVTKTVLYPVLCDGGAGC